VGARVNRIGAKSLHFEHVIVYKGTEDIVADGVSVGAWVDYAEGKSIPIPDGLRQAIRDFDGLP